MNPDGPPSWLNLDPAIQALRSVRTGQAVAEWKPLPGPQTKAFHCEADELYYGGQAGGGKTDLLLGLAGTSHHRSIIFRRVFKEFRELIERSREVLDSIGSYNESLHIWRLNDGRMIELASIDHPKQLGSYKGRPHDLKAWDEVSEFTELMFRFVNAWNRTTRQGQRCRVVATGNPPTNAEGEWIIRYWGPWLDEQYPHPAKPGELRWFANVDGKDVECGKKPFRHKGELIVPRSRTFIPAKLSDNPYLEKTGYRAVLQGLPEPLRSQMLYGDHSIGQADDARQVIPTAWIKAAQARWTEERPTCAMTAMGVDPARGGTAQMVIAPRYRNWFAPLIKHPGKTVPDGLTAATLVANEVQARAIVNIDIGGIGTSPYDSIVALKTIRVFGLNGAEASDETDKSELLHFANKRAEWYWKLREALDPMSGEDIALPPDPELLADLCAPRFEVKARGIQIESKDDIIRRLGRSPDCGDAVVYAHAMHGQILSDVVVGSSRPASSLASGYSGSRFGGDGF